MGAKALKTAHTSINTLQVQKKIFFSRNLTSDLVTFSKKK